MRFLLLTLLAFLAVQTSDASCCCGCCCPCPCCCTKPIVIKLPPPPTKIVPCCCCCKPCCCCCPCCCGGRRKRALASANARGALGNAALVPRMSNRAARSCEKCQECKGQFADQSRSCVSDCVPSTTKRSRQKRSVIAVLREKLAEKKLVIRAKSAFRDNILFDLF